MSKLEEGAAVVVYQESKKEIPKNEQNMIKREEERLQNQLNQTNVMTHGYLNEMNYQHEWVNHSLGFVDPNNPRTHTNNIELRWSHLRKYVKRNTGLNWIEIYLNNFMFFFHTTPDIRYRLLIKCFAVCPDCLKE